MRWMSLSHDRSLEDEDTQPGARAESGTTYSYGPGYCVRTGDDTGTRALWAGLTHLHTLADLVTAQASPHPYSSGAASGRRRYLPHLSHRFHDILPPSQRVRAARLCRADHRISTY